ncbi:hypothetical protein Sango_3094000 [Sesamum angolense]|uniref:Reverse transcriptase domain-containing protein n=1 Tax=Sesamum angolense TaxID=2727404 RepID=A0AAE1T9M2_9LAMI|nr:hypothetical protein Sango_3094000 [Sesamum angolense]
MASDRTGNVRGCGRIFQHGENSETNKYYLLALIPKVNMPTYVSDYRPIACCNVIYKAITKILVKRLQRVLPLLIDYSQNAFVPGRSISDNILLAQELLTGYNQVRLPARCMLKVDIQKAYDSVEWDFLLEEVGDFDKVILYHRIYSYWPLIDKVDTRLAGWNNLNLSSWKCESGLGPALQTKSGRRTRNQKSDYFKSGADFETTMEDITNDGTSIWVDWIQHNRLRHTTIWTFNRDTGSWGWKKMLKLRPLLQRGVIYKVGDGSSFNLWQDIWHDRGPLCLTYPRGPAVTGLPLSSTLSSVLQRNSWCWPASTDTDVAEIISQLPPTYPTATDTIYWEHLRMATGHYLGEQKMERQSSSECGIPSNVSGIGLSSLG